MLVKKHECMKRILIVLFLTYNSIVSATNYYVSSTTGDDSRDGLSEATAWKTISKVNSKTFLPGDMILFNRGDEWRESLSVPSSGNAGAYVIFSAYGSGEKPRILGSTQAITWTNQGGNIWKSSTSVSNPWASEADACELFFVHSDGTVSWGWHVGNTGSMSKEYDWTWSSNNVYVYAATDPSTRYTSVEVPQRDVGIDVNTREYVTVDGLDVKYHKFRGVAGNEVVGGTGFTIKNCNIGYVGTKNNTLSDSPVGYCLDVVRNNLLVQNNDIHDGGRRIISYHIYDYSGVTFSGITIEGNILHEGYHGSGFGIAMDGPRSNNTFTNIIIRNNLIYDSPTRNLTTDGFDPTTQGHIAAGESGAKISNVQVYNNIWMYGTAYGLELYNVTNATVYNNTFYNFNPNGSSLGYRVQLDISHGSTGIVIKNNIFYNSVSYDVLHSQPAIYLEGDQPRANVTIDYNLFYEVDTRVGMIDLAGTYYTNSNWSSMKSSTGWQSHEPGIVNPLFVSTTDLHLQPGSPAIGAGIAIPEIVTDYEGNPYTNPPNIGCYATPVISGNPVYLSSVIENATPSLLEMTYNKSLANVVPAATAFTVMVNSTAMTVNTVVISGTKVQLTLASPVVYGDVVTVAYTQPGTNPLQSSSGDLAASIGSKTVTNNVVSTIPAYVSSVIANATPSLLTMTYSMALANVVPDVTAFVVQVNSVARTINSVTLSGTTVRLTLASPVVAGDVVTVSYTQPATNPLQSAAGGKAVSISAKPVTNNVNSTIPVYVSSVIENASPALLTITYSMSLANIIPSSSAFTVRVNSVTRAVNTIAVIGTTVQLTLVSPVVYGDIVTVAYTQPATNPLQTASGGKVATSAAQTVTNNVNAIIPLYVSSVIENATPALLTMTYNLSLANIIPAVSAFTVRVNAVARAVNTVTVSGTTVQLTLASPVAFGDVITVAYAQPATNPLQTASGGKAASITAQPVTNNVNIVVPVYVSAVIEDASPASLTMTYNSNLGNIVPAASSFLVQVNSVARTISSVSVSGTTVKLTLASPVVFGDIVTVAYTQPATNPLQSASGGKAASITDQAVTNNVNAVIPVYVSSVIENASPALLTMTYSLNLSNIPPDASAFTVMVNSVTRAVSAVAVSGTKVQLTLATPVIYGDIITVAYTQPSSNPLQSTLGGKAATISAKPVTNNLALAVPVYQSSVIQDATPNILEITFNLSLANIIPSASAFRVRVNSVTRTVTAVAISGTKVTLTLATRVVYGDIVTVSYTRPYTRPLQTPQGGRVASFSAKPVTNNVKSIVAPVYVSAVIQDATPALLEITYDLTLANIVPAASAFTVMVNSVSRTVNAVAISGTKVLLTLATPVVYADVVTVSYTKPASNPLQTPPGGQAVTIGAQPVTNNINNTTSINNPVYVSSSVEDATPALLVMTYDRTLNNSMVPPSSAFSVTVNSITISVTSVAIAGSNVRLTLADTILYGDVVTVSYTKPSSNQLQTTSGGQAASISDQPVTNNIVLVIINTPPVPVIEYTTISYSGFISDIDATKSYDSDNDPLIFLWTAPGNVSVSSTSNSKIQFLAPLVQEATIIEFNLSVSDGESIQTQTVPITIVPYKPELSVANLTKVEASSYENPDYPKNVADNNRETSWSSNGNDQWLIMDLSQPFKIDHLGVTFPSELKGSSYFDIYASTDTINWEPVLLNAASCSFSGDFQVFIFPESRTATEYSYIKLVGHGNSVDSWNNFSEIQIFGRPHYEDIHIVIYPNPASQLINIAIKYPNTIPLEEAILISPSVRIYSTSGILVYEKTLDPGINNVQIPINLKTGVYIVQMLSGKVTVAASKLVVFN